MAVVRRGVQQQPQVLGTKKRITMVFWSNPTANLADTLQIFCIHISKVYSLRRSRKRSSENEVPTHLPTIKTSFHMSNEKNPGWLGYIGDYTTQLGIIINHYKDPYYTTSIMESHKGFFRGSHELIELHDLSSFHM